MSIKDLFDKNQTGKILSSKTRETLTDGIESVDYLTAHAKDKERYLPPVDFSKPENFAHYGSAEQYYSNSIKKIYNTYPYDGSLKEKLEWENSASYLDKFIFEREYPRRTGYIHIGKTYGTLGNSSQGYFTSSVGEFIVVKGGPHASPTGDMKDGRFNKTYNEHPAANVFHTASNRGSNLLLDGDKGSTVEFWLKKSLFVSPHESSNQVIFDLWNSGNFGDHDYGRFRVETRPSATGSGDRLWVSLISGAHGTTTSGPAGGIYDGSSAALATSIGSNIAITGSTWKHYAISVANTGSAMRLRLYVDGQLHEQKILGNSIGSVPGAMKGYIGALATSVSGAYASTGWGKLSGSIDEFRYWKTERTPKQIGRFWRTQVGGGTNTDDANTQLGVYYKFNEGATGTGSVDSKVLDYSGRISNGSWVGYASGSRNVVSSAIVEASASATEFRDPIVYSFHPKVLELASSSSLKAKEWDYSNNSSIYRSFPSWIIDEDEEKDGNNLKKLTHIMASVFDNLQLQIDYLPNLKQAGFPSSSLGNKLSYKPRPFSDHLLESYGFDTSELFEDITALEKYYNRNEHTLYEEKLHDLKNLIYQNIYNGISRIYKSKGTERALRNLIRCFGIDDELLKINLYGNEVTYKLEENYRTISQAKKYADFNDYIYSAEDYSTDRAAYSAVVYQAANPIDSNTVSFISGTDVDSEKYLDGFSFTAEAEAIFPKPSQTKKYYISYPHLTCSVFGMNQVDSRLPTDQTTWHTGNVAQFNVYAVKPDKDSLDARFILTNENNDFFLSSSTYYDVFDNSKWNFAVSVRPKKHPFTDIVTGTKLSSSGPIHLPNALDDYILEFYGTNTEYGTIVDEFSLTSSLPYLTGNILVSAPKKVYAGALRTNTTGTILKESNAKISSVRYWLDYLTSSVIQAHARDALNFGSDNPYKNSYLFKSGISTTYADGKDGSYPFIPKMETLALNWDFSNVTGSDSTGIFYVNDFSSGSSLHADRYGRLSGILNNLHSGKGQYFVTSSHHVVDKIYTPSARQQLPEVLNSSDMVNILKRDDTTFTRETRPIQYYIAIEKSMYQTISEEILNFFSSVKDFSNLIGEPVNRYRQEYKSLEKLRQLFFERIHNTPDLDKYVEFYKWFDSSITKMIMNLIPASANTSGQVHNMVESHILERNKYWTKFPTLESKGKDPVAKVMGINELSYNWKYGHAPLPNSPLPENKNCFWWKERAERSQAEISSSVPGVNLDKESLLKTITTEVSASGPVLYDTSTSKAYEGSTYALRKLSKTYRFDVDKSVHVKGGPNSYENKKKDYYKNTLKWNDSNSFIRIHKNDFVENTDCNDITNPLTESKIKFKASTHMSTDSEYTTGKGELYVPFSLHSSSVTQGYVGDLAKNTMLDITNLHEDNYYGNTKETPLQGPFTEKYVGGLQYRHTELNYQDDKKSLDTESTRAEGWYLKVPIGGLYLNNFIDEGFEYGSSVPESLRASSSYLPTDWQNLGSTAIDPSGWISMSGSTPTFGTGPSGSYSSGWYMYAETSVPNTNGKTFGLVTPSIDPLDVVNNFSASFRYHMFGWDCGELKIQYSTDSAFGTATDLVTNWDGTSAISIAGQQQASAVAPWKLATVDLNSFKGTETPIYLRFLYTSGITHEGDVAIDDVNIVGDVIDSFRVYDVTYQDANRPRATHYRDEFAKRPVNIRNIKMTSSSPTRAGNYTDNYQVVQTQGRDVNNLWLVQGETGSAWQPSISTYVSGVLDFRLPDRSYLTSSTTNVRNRTVFAERFSAPGGPEVLSRGAMDITSETYSPYNALPWRNLSVRQPLRGFLTTHNRKFGFKMNDNTASIDFMSAGTASYHKIHRNAGYRRQLEPGTGQDGYASVVSASYDNYYIQHTIPRSERQYAWITASLNTHAQGESAPLGYATGAYSADKKSSEITFLAQSEVGSFLNNYARWTGATASMNKFIPVDFVGLNTNITDPITSNQNFLGHPASAHDSDSITSFAYQGALIHMGYAASHTSGQPEILGFGSILNQLLHHRNGPYGHPSWKQIRTGDHPVAKNLRKNNLHSVNVVEEEIKNTDIYTPMGNKIPGQKPEPPLGAPEGTYDFGTLEGMPGGYAPGNSEATVVEQASQISIFKNKLLFFTESAVTSRNKPIRTDFDPLGQGKGFSLKHTYDNNRAYYKNEYLNLINKTDAGKFSSNIPFPEKQTYDLLLPIIRDGSDQYGSETTIGDFRSLAYSMTIFPKDINTYIASKSRRPNYTELPGAAQDGPDAVAGYDSVNYRTFWRNSHSDRVRTDGTARNISGQKIDSGLLGGQTTGSIPYLFDTFPGDRVPIFSGTSHTPVQLSMWPLDDNTYGATLSASGPTMAAYGGGQCWLFYSGSHPTGPYAPAGYLEQGQSIDSNTLQGLRGSPGQLALDTTPLLKMGIPTASAYFNRDPYSNWFAVDADQDSDKYFYKFPLGSTSASSEWGYTDSGYGTTNLSYFYKNAPSGQKGWIKTAPYYRANKIAGRNPWYDSYEDYSEDIRRFGKDYAVLPEYKMSDKIDYYLESFDMIDFNPAAAASQIDESKALTVGSKTFVLDGAYKATSSYSPGSNALKPDWDMQFINDHCTTDSMVSLKKIHEDLTSLDPGQGTQQQDIVPTHIILRLDAIKKLLPYNGFYPATRTQQLAQLYQESINPFIRTTGTIGPHGEALYEAGKMQAAFQPLFAPGILFNSIKSGIAVDWPNYILNAPATNEGENSNWGGATGFNMTNNWASGSSLSTDPDYRVPFESLVNLDRLVPNAIGFDLNGLPKMIARSSPLIEPTFGSASGPSAGSSDDYGQSFDWNYGSVHSFVWDDKKRNKQFEIAMNNFIAEVPNFFLKSRGRNGIFSADSSQMNTPEVGKTYYMEVVLEKIEHPVTYDLVMAEGPRDQLILSRFTGAFSPNTAEHGYLNHQWNFADPQAGPRKGYIFGPPAARSASANAGKDVYPNRPDVDTVHWPHASRGWRQLTGSSDFDHVVQSIASRPSGSTSGSADRFFNNSEMDPAYAMYTPPYYYGKSVAQIRWTAPDSEEGGANAVSIDEIMSQIQGSSVTDKVGVSYYNEYDSIIVPNSNASFDLLSPQRQSDIVKDQDGNRTGVHIRAKDLLHPYSIAAKNTMAITASLNLFDKIPVKQVQYGALAGPDGKFGVKGYSDSDGFDKIAWAIRPKWECPVICVSASSYDSGYNHDVESGPYFSKRTGRSIWNSYANVHSEDPSQWIYEGGKPIKKGIKYYLREAIDQNDPNYDINKSGSLIQLLKFDSMTNMNSIADSTGDTEIEKRVGELADSAEVAECIVAIPYVEEPIENLTVQPFRKVSNGHIINAIPINQNSYYHQFLNLRNPEVDYVAIEGSVKRSRTSISDLIKNMRKYIFPPMIDFYSQGLSESNLSEYSETKVSDAFGSVNTSQGILPFVMYTFEITSKLDKKDLGDIWQNIMPKQATAAEQEFSVKSHGINKSTDRWEFFGMLDQIKSYMPGGNKIEYYDGPDIPDDSPAGNKSSLEKIFNQELKWLVFKVKKRANNRYESLMDMDAFKDNDTVSIKEKISYNWPHDFYSLSELNKLTAEIMFGPRSED